jgi:hypothetical protein
MESARDSLTCLAVKKIHLAWLFPRLLNTYGDGGNIAAIRRRCELRNIEVQLFLLDDLGRLESLDPDVIVLGGAQDRDEACISRHIRVHRNAVLSAVARGSLFFAVCAGYQLLGNFYAAPSGAIIEGLGILDMHTIAGQGRCIGYACVDSTLPGVGRVVGFENHAGRTYLGTHVAPLGSVACGFGNNGSDGLEGAISGNIIATYLHGPVLIANPRLTDFIITRALERTKQECDLLSLDDTHEIVVHELMFQKAQQRCSDMSGIKRRLSSARLSLQRR